MIKVRLKQREISSNREWWSEHKIYGYSPIGEVTFDAFKWGVVVIAIFNDDLSEEEQYKKRKCLEVEVIHKDFWEIKK